MRDPDEHIRRIAIVLSEALTKQAWVNMAVFEVLQQLHAGGEVTKTKIDRLEKALNASIDKLEETTKIIVEVSKHGT